MAPSPQDYANRLTGKIRAQAKHARTYDDYYTGTRRLMLVEREYRSIFGSDPTQTQSLALRPPDTNVSAVGVDALSERLQLEGFNLAAETGDEEEPTEQSTRAAREVEQASRDLWIGSDMDVMQSVANLEALVKGRSFLHVTQGPDGAVMTVEDPEQVAVMRSPAPPYDVVAAFKVRADEWGGPDVGTLWLPGQVHEGRRSSDGSGWAMGSGTPATSEVPMYELAYRQRLLAEPRSYIAPVASMADSFALLMAYLVIAARYGAVPIVTMSGVRLPRDPLTGMVLPFGSDPSRPDLPPKKVGASEALASEDPNARFGRIEAGQLAGFIAACEMLLGSITAIHRVPATYYGQGARSGTSGETVKASEAGLDRRRLDMQRYLGSTYRRATSAALSLDLGRPVRVVPRWANTETRMESQLADAFTKYFDGGNGLPLQIVLEHLGFESGLIARAMAMRGAEQGAAEQLLAAVGARTGSGGDTPPVQDDPDLQA